MLYNIFFETFGRILLIYSILNEKMNSDLMFRNVSKIKNETFYLLFSKIPRKIFEKSRLVCIISA